MLIINFGYSPLILFSFLSHKKSFFDHLWIKVIHNFFTNNFVALNKGILLEIN